MEDVKVMIGGVRGDSEVGHIAFVAVQPGVQGLKKGRGFV
jgi:hypothetical protein